MKIGAHEYQIGKLDPRRQFHVIRRMGPVLGPYMNAMNGDDSAPMLTALATMKDEDVDYILDTTLSVVARRQDTPGGVVFAPVMPRPGQCMFSDLAMDEMLQLAVAVVQDSLGSFFTIAQPVTTEAASK